LWAPGIAPGPGGPRSVGSACLLAPIIAEGQLTVGYLCWTS